MYSARLYFSLNGNDDKYCLIKKLPKTHLVSYKSEYVGLLFYNERLNTDDLIDKKNVT